MASREGLAPTSAVRAALLAWYRQARRDLPWRGTRDPYRVWVSEIMLQQTRVETIVPRWRRFLDRFPTVGALAAAPLDDLLAEWAGLGYYARARNLHAAAREVVERYGGRVPDDPSALRALPGVGRYTAGAIASICFQREEPIVDGNVERVLARLDLVETDVRRAPARAALWARAAELVRGESPGDLNQALMELGARVCLPRAPQCPLCPLRSHCRAHAAGRAEALPAKPRRAEVREATLAAALVRRPRGLLLWRRPPHVTLFGGLWELPSIELETGEDADGALARLGRDVLGVTVRSSAPRGSVTHELSHLRLTVHLHEVTLGRGRPRRSTARYDALRTVAPGATTSLGVSALTTRLLGLAGP